MSTLYLLFLKFVHFTLDKALITFDQFTLCFVATILVPKNLIDCVLTTFDLLKPRLVYWLDGQIDRICDEVLPVTLALSAFFVALHPKAHNWEPFTLIFRITLNSYHISISCWFLITKRLGCFLFIRNKIVDNVHLKIVVKVVLIIFGSELRKCKIFGS